MVLAVFRKPLPAPVDADLMQADPEIHAGSWEADHLAEWLEEVVTDVAGSVASSRDRAAGAVEVAEEESHEGEGTQFSEQHGGAHL